jgi:hypothetical protein
VTPWPEPPEIGRRQGAMRFDNHKHERERTMAKAVIDHRQSWDKAADAWVLAKIARNEPYGCLAQWIPANRRAALKRLEDAGKITCDDEYLWHLTPKGRKDR